MTTIFEPQATVLVKSSPIAMISVELLQVIAARGTGLEQWVEPLRAACTRAEINTIRRVASFLANIAVECGFKPRAENLNYSVEGLRTTFGRHRISAEDCARFGQIGRAHV